MGDKWGIASSLETFASLEVAAGQPERAARLWGVAQMLRETIGIPLPAGERAHIERDVRAAHAQIDESTFTKAWAEGRTLALEQAIAAALDDASLT